MFNSGLVHEVPAVVGDAKARIVLATFIGYSDDDGACMPLRVCLVWRFGSTPTEVATPYMGRCMPAAEEIFVWA